MSVTIQKTKNEGFEMWAVKLGDKIVHTAWSKAGAKSWLLSLKK